MLDNLFYVSSFQIKHLSVPKLFITSVIVRGILLAYGSVHDTLFTLKYTDIDYIVFSDAAMHVCIGDSPYQRETYRYTPLLAWVLVPNCYFPLFGKILFSLLDVLAGYVIYSVVNGDYSKRIALCFWLFNPLNIIVCTRGNAESVVCVMVLLTLAFLKSRSVRFAAILYGLSVHFKVYPIVYALPFYLYCGTMDGKKNKTLFQLLLNRKGFEFGIISGSVFILLAALFYSIYGYEFLSETYLYHITRTDTKHNFSPYFYMLHLSRYSDKLPIIGTCVFLPQLILVLYTGYKLHEQIELAVFSQTAVFATFNKVVTSQYFLWYLSIIPLLIPQSTLSLKTAVNMFSMWIVAQLLWLLPAYLYEFQGYPTYPLLWLSGLVFFSVNVYSIVLIIRHHAFT